MSHFPTTSFITRPCFLPPCLQQLQCLQEIVELLYWDFCKIFAEFNISAKSKCFKRYVVFLLRVKLVSSKVLEEEMARFDDGKTSTKYTRPRKYVFMAVANYVVNVIEALLDSVFI